MSNMTNDKRSSTAEGLCLANAYDVNKATSRSMTQACHENNSLPIAHHGCCPPHRSS